MKVALHPDKRDVINDIHGDIRDRRESLLAAAFLTNPFGDRTVERASASDDHEGMYLFFVKAARDDAEIDVRLGRRGKAVRVEQYVEADGRRFWIIDFEHELGYVTRYQRLLSCYIAEGQEYEENTVMGSALEAPAHSLLIGVVRPGTKIPADPRPFMIGIIG